jgi:integrase
LSSLIGPRVSELSLLRMGDLRWDLGRFGKVVLHGKGSLGRGKKDRLVPLINGARELLEWWVTGPRWAFDDRVNDPLAPVFPSERRNDDATSSPVETDALRYGLAVAVGKHFRRSWRACHDNCVSHGWTKIGRRDRHSVGRGTICESGYQHRRS